MILLLIQLHCFRILKMFLFWGKELCFILSLNDLIIFRIIDTLIDGPYKWNSKGHFVSKYLKLLILSLLYNNLSGLLHSFNYLGQKVGPL